MNAPTEHIFLIFMVAVTPLSTIGPPVPCITTYVPDACKAILKALQEQPELFAAADGDECVPSELIFCRFYTGP